MTDDPARSFGTLPDWARDVFEATRKEQAARVADPLDDAAAWPLLVDAAVVSKFLPGTLAPGATPSPMRSEAETRVLSVAEPTLEPTGVRWSLRRDARERIVDRARQTGELTDAIARTATRFHDDVSVAMRKCLQGQVDTSVQPLHALEATRVAVGMLSGVEGLSLPGLDELDAHIERERLLVQFDRMVGTTGGAPQNHFVGRDDELLRLRAYVGIIRSETLTESLKRGVRSIRRAVTGWAPLAVTGIGGVGKTTLIAKFMLEHARAPSRFPFAYIDFDRPGLSARHRAGVLAEMALQVAAQFPELAGPLRELRAQVLELGRKLERGQEASFITPVAPHLARFRQLVDAYLEDQEWPFQWPRPFLLVFDTFEVVQYSPVDERSLSEFVAVLSEGGTWNRLRVVISGRNPVTVFEPIPETIELGGLEDTAAAELLAWFAEEAGKPLEPKDARRLVDGIAAADPATRTRFKPQRLRIIGEQFKDPAYPTGTAVVDSILSDLSEGQHPPGPVMRALIDAILIRRTLGNVADARVRALADPGLVVRRITPQVIQHVMVPGTPRPGTLSPDDPDPETFEPWSVDADEARAIFEAFKTEITLVNVEDGALWHREDVREDMLPVIRFGRPKRFAALHRLAYDYFRALADSNPSEAASAAEAVYHGLWCGAPLLEVDRYWPRQPTLDVRINPGEFDPGSPPDIYLRARTRTGRRLEAAELAQLPQPLALDWLDGAKFDLLLERQPGPTLGAIRQAVGADFLALDAHADLAAAVARLLLRNGDWGEAIGLARRHLEGRRLSDPSLVSLFRTFGTVAGKCSVSADDVAKIIELAAQSSDPVVRVEALGHAMLGMRGHSRQRDRAMTGEVVQAVYSVSPTAWRSEPRCLRLALLAVPDLPADLFTIYIQSTERLPHDTVAIPVLHELFAAAYRGREKPPRALLDLEAMQGSPRSDPSAFEEIDRSWRTDRDIFVRAIADSPGVTDAWRWLMAYQHFDWILPLGNAIATTSAREEGLGAMLRKANVPNRSSWLTRDGRIEGVVLAQVAAENGHIRDIAELLSSHAAAPRGDYPSDAAGMGDALLRWHSAIVATLEDDERQRFSTR